VAPTTYFNTEAGNQFSPYFTFAHLSTHMKQAHLAIIILAGVGVSWHKRQALILAAKYCISTATALSSSSLPTNANNRIEGRKIIELPQFIDPGELDFDVSS
jgi:hypothetical protein